MLGCGPGPALGGAVDAAGPAFVAARAPQRLIHRRVAARAVHCDEDLFRFGTELLGRATHSAMLGPEHINLGFQAEYVFHQVG